MTQKFEVTQTEIEHGRTVKYMRTCTITTENFYGEPKDYQVERWYRNGQLLNSSSYPAHTDYAISRLAGMKVAS